jgi:hypothetical protein
MNITELDATEHRFITNKLHDARYSWKADGSSAGKNPKVHYYEHNIPPSGTELGYGLDDCGFESRQGLGIFLSTTVSRPTLEPTRVPYPAVKWPGREYDHSPPSRDEVRNAWSYTSTPPVHLHGVVLS